MSITFAQLVVYRSEDGRTNWQPVKGEDVPDFVRDPDVMARLADGEECMDCAQGNSGSAWYRAVSVEKFSQPVLM